MHRRWSLSTAIATAGAAALAVLGFWAVVAPGLGGVSPSGIDVAALLYGTTVPIAGFPHTRLLGILELVVGLFAISAGFVDKRSGRAWLGGAVAGLGIATAILAPATGRLLGGGGRYAAAMVVLGAVIAGSDFLGQPQERTGPRSPRTREAGFPAGGGRRRVVAEPPQAEATAPPAEASPPSSAAGRPPASAAPAGRPPASAAPAGRSPISPAAARSPATAEPARPAPAPAPASGPLASPPTPGRELRSAVAPILSADPQLEEIDRLARLAELRDDDTGTHIDRMSRYSELIGKAVGFVDDECTLLRYAVRLHDIGKIGIPDEILRKPGKLTDEEFGIMRRHTSLGGDVLAGSTHPLIRMAEAIARSHHERWDGSGYPRGLKGEEIPLVGRISAVADVFDALTTRRPYKEAWPATDALAEIVRNSGKHFDPDVVTVFTGMYPDIVATMRQLAGKPVEPVKRPGGLLDSFE